MKEIFDSIKVQVNERLSSPLFGSFLIAWICWNHRLLTVLFSSLPVNDRFEYIDKTLYPKLWDPWMRGFLFPLGFAFLFILIYPLVARPIYHYWQWHQQKQKELRDKIEGQKILTVEESQNAIKRAYEIVRQSDEENRRLREELNATKRSLSDANAETTRSHAEEDLPEWQKRSMESEARIKELEARLNDTIKRSINPPMQWGPPATENSMSTDAIELLLTAAKDDKGIIRNIPVIGGLIVETNGREFVQQGDARSRARWESAIAELVQEKLITPLGGQYHRVTKEGFAFVDTLPASDGNKDGSPNPPVYL